MDNYTDILNRMKENFKSVCGYAPSDMSDEGIRLRAYATEILDCKIYAKWLEKQMFIQTATGACLDKHALEYDIVRNKGTKATGSIAFFIHEARDTAFKIPAGTKVISATGQVYTTDETGYIKAQEKVVVLNITAVEPGCAGNCGVGDIREISDDNEIYNVGGLASKSLVGVKNSAPILGGTDDEHDEHLRARIIQAIKSPPTGANKTYYLNLACQVDGVRSVGFLGSMTSSGTVYMYLGGMGGTVTSKTVADVQDKMDRLGQIGIVITAAAATEVPVNINLSVSAAGEYGIEEVKDNCITAVNEFLTTRCVGEKITEKSILSYLYNHAEGLDEAEIKNAADFPNIHGNELAVPGDVLVNAL